MYDELEMMSICRYYPDIHLEDEEAQSDQLTP
jgi:hypothetical protein